MKLRLGHILVIRECFPRNRLVIGESSATAWNPNVALLLILAAFRIRRAVIDEAVILEFFLTSFSRREEDESAGLDREYWERVNQVQDPVEIF